MRRYQSPSWILFLRLPDITLYQIGAAEHDNPALFGAAFGSRSRSHWVFRCAMASSTPPYSRGLSFLDAASLSRWSMSSTLTWWCTPGILLTLKFLAVNDDGAQEFIPSTFDMLHVRLPPALVLSADVLERVEPGSWPQ